MSKYNYFLYIIIENFIFYLFSKLTFPDNVKDYDFKNLMQHMLDKNLDTRYSKFTPKPYLDYVKTLNDWEPPEKMKEPERMKRIEFNEWLKKF